jgi:hypothetical protein
MAAICVFFPSKSKRVPELEDPLLDIVGSIDEFAFHRCFLGEMAPETEHYTRSR